MATILPPGKTFFLVPLLAGALAAGETDWYRIPFAEPHRARALYCQGDRLWVGDDGGLHESRDGGDSWRPVAPLAGKGVYALGGTDSFLVVLRDDGIHRSIDSGRTWQRAEGERPLFSSMGNRFLARNDSLFLESYGTELNERRVSSDQGRSWVSLGYSTSPVHSDSLEPFPGQWLKLVQGSLSQSDDGGATWTRLPWPPPWGSPLALSAGSGNTYVLSSGMILRRRGSAARWEILQASVHPAVIRQLAVSGNNLCASTDFAVSCSRDGGNRFRIMGRNPFPVGWIGARGSMLDYSFSIAVDQDRLYLASLDIYGPNHLWTRSLADSGSWSQLVFSSKDTVLSPIAVAREGCLIVFEEGRPSTAHISWDQGGTFRKQSIGSISELRVAALSRTHWALATARYLHLSQDSGKTWRIAYNHGGNSKLLLSLTDTDLYTAGKSRFSLQDSTWSAVQAPGSVLAASDSAWYAVSGDTLWSKSHLPDPTAVHGPRARIGRPSSREAQVRDLLGKITRRPARGFRSGR